MSRRQINWVKWGTIAALLGLVIGAISVLPIIGGITTRAVEIWNMPPEVRQMAHDVAATRQDVRDIKISLRIQELVDGSETNSPYVQKHENENNVLR